ncbi:amphi-Trp domain-containing protein [Rhodovulum adriaticum]|uniref:Amphi-Trp domain-containing protein n=1 Tax=Rhodovulum adriaticum TaxID=35804 RepID=A0A4R2NLU2_RHOAD|nr:amphi-Trp domain-containing protein [Rhodovulum adriaticum]MBK1635774.1 amphi-Trp domain-containing protein [Rhodovulum adriaticum]TCP22511.1 amphi-Trp domain-containing protein [Rhodovulum adriaticum]
MADKTTRFAHESLQDRKTIKTLLTALSKGFGKGRLTLGDDDREMVLETADLMTLRITAEREDGACQVTLKVTWNDPAQPSRPKGAPKISS